MSIIEIIPTFSKKSNSGYGIRYENEIIRSSLIHIKGLSLIDEPDLYYSDYKTFEGLKMIPIEKGLKTEEEICNELFSKRMEGDFEILPALNEKITIKINGDQYFIKYYEGKIFLYDKDDKDISQTLRFYNYKISNLIKFDKFVFTTCNLNKYQNEMQKDQIKAIGEFGPYLIFFFESKMENDGLFFAKEDIVLNIYQANIEISFDNDGKKFDKIKKNSIIIYETKSHNDYSNLISQIKFRVDFAKKFLNYFKDKINFENEIYYLGFFKDNNKIENLEKNSDITSLKNKHINFALFRIENTFFGEELQYSQRDLNNMNLLINKTIKIEEGLDSLKKDFKNEISNVRNEMNQKFETLNNTINKNQEGINAIISLMQQKKDENNIINNGESKNFSANSQENNNNNNNANQLVANFFLNLLTPIVEQIIEKKKG